MSRNLGEHIALWTIGWVSGLFLGGAAVGAVVVLAVMMATPARSQSLCANHSAMLASLKANYREEIVAVGTIGNDGSRLEITASPSGTWTVIAVDTRSGVACLMMAGKGWKPIIPGQDA